MVWSPFQMVSLKYLSNFWRIFKIPLTNCERSVFSKWSAKNCIPITGTSANQNPRFQINDTKLNVPVVTLSTQENKKLLKKLDSGFKRTIKWNKYLPKTINQVWDRRLDFLIDPNFQGVNRLFVLSFENN